MLEPSGGSLGQAIQALKTDLPPETAKAEARKAEQQAKQDIKRAKKEARLAERQAEALSRQDTQEY
jgi:hypothetical protein